MIGDLIQDDFNQIGGLVARQSNLLVDGFAQVRSGDRSSRHIFPHWIGLTVALPKKSVNIKGMGADL